MFKFISYSGLYISLCAVCYNYFYCHLLNNQFMFSRLVLIFFATLFSYICVQLVPIYKTNVFHPRQLWFRNNRYLLGTIMFVSILGIVTCSFYLTLTELFIYAHLFLIVIFYEKVVTKKNELRKVPFLKPFLISYVWATMATTFYALNSEYFYIHMLESFLFILSITIPFDIRDKEQDQKQNLITLVHILGERNLKILCFICYLVSQVILLRFINVNTQVLYSAFIMLVFYFSILYKTKNNQHDYYFLYGMDSLIILKLLLLL